MLPLEILMNAPIPAGIDRFIPGSCAVGTPSDRVFTSIYVILHAGNPPQPSGAVPLSVRSRNGMIGYGGNA